jgi:hypothetical protein
MEERPNLVPLAAMARIVHVSTKWLREQAASGTIPSLDAGGARLFHAPTVEKLLMIRAMGQEKAEAANV